MLSTVGTEAKVYVFIQEQLTVVNTELANMCLVCIHCTWVLPRNFCQRGKQVASFPGKKGARAYYGARAMRLLMNTIKSRHV